MKANWISFIVLLFAVQFSGYLCSNGICTSNVIRLVYTTRYKSKLIYYSQHYQYNCGIFGWDWDKCSAYRTRSYYSSTSYSAPVYQLSQTQYCCPGYGGSVSNGYCSPICINPSCVHGYCSLPETCSCYEGWNGTACDEAICTNECVHGSCTAPGICTCDKGWTGDTCNEDVPECQIDNGGCDHECIESLGSYHCECEEGYKLSEDDSHSCQDINECDEDIVIIADTLEEAQQLHYNDSTTIVSSGDEGEPPLHWCQHLCMNTNGSYECECREGYSLSMEDNSTCTDINECEEDDNGRCEHNCHNTNGSYYCTCDEGFILLEDKRGCTDRDECNRTMFNHSCSQTCHNTHGGYRCSCEDGYRLDQVDLKYCHDVDECSDGINDCSDICHNTIGSYYCTCNHGYEMMADNVTCKDINECMLNNNNGGCDHICTNLPGSYQCQCKPGYLLSHDKHSCYGEPCDSFLASPTNGTIHCTGPQVTGESCHFTCDPGYHLTGSDIRECMYNHSWSGTHPSCEPLHCPGLEAPGDARVVSPCDHRFMSKCMIICDYGYYVGGELSDVHYWTQSCVLNGSQTAVEWSQAESCTKSDPCDSNPCQPGTCSLTLSGQVSCDCGTSLHYGDRCDSTHIYIDSIPILTANVSHTVTITSSLTKQRSLSTDILGGSTILTAKPQTVILDAAANAQQTSSNSFSLTASQPGIYGISYQVNPSANVAKPDDSIVLVKGGQVSGQNDYFDRFSLEEGILREGCCRHGLPATSGQCMSEIVLTSSCEWAVADGGHWNTKGIVFIGSRAITLPLSISGISINSASSSTELSILFNTSSSNCSKCTTPSGSKHSKCLSTGTAVEYNAHDTELFLSKNSLVKTVLSVLSPILPSWLSINVWPTTDTPSYSLYDYTSLIATGQELQSMPYCSIISPSDNALYYVLRTKVPLHVKIDTFNTFLYTLQLSPQCIVIDMCTSGTPTVHLHVPSDLQPSQLTNLRYFQQLVADNGELSMATVSVSQNGFRPWNEPQSQYWAGSGYVTPSLSTYEFQAQVKFDKVFKGGDLEAHVMFEGLAYHTSDEVDNQKVPGLLEGDITLSISTIINGSRIQLLLHGEEAIFSYPGMSSSSALLSSGISFKLVYNGHLSLPLSEVSTVDDEDCPVDAFLALDDDLRINNFTIASDCLELRLGRVLLPATAFTRVLLFNGDVDSTSFAVFSKLTIPKFSIGDFFHLIQQDSSRSGIELWYTSNTGPSILTGIMHNANVSVFDGHLNTDLYITDDGSTVTFQGQTTLFSHFDVSVSGIASLVAADLELFTEIEFVDQVNQFKADLTNFLKSHVLNEYNNLMKSKVNSDLVTNSTKVVLNQLTSTIEALETQTNTMTNKLNELNSTITSLEVKVNTLKELLKITLLNHGMSPACIEGTKCPLVSVETVECETCHKIIQVPSPKTCNRFVQKQRFVNKYNSMIKVQSQRYVSRCSPCWEVIWYVLPFFSQNSCCHTESQPYVQNTSLPYQTKEYYMEEEEYRCTEYVNEQMNGMCCNSGLDGTPDGGCITNEFLCVENEYLKATVPYTVRQMYIQYADAKVELTLAELEHSLLVKKIAHVMEERRVMSNIVDGLVSAQAIRSELKSEIQQNIETFSKLFDQGNNEIKTIKILDIGFNYTLTNHTPLSVPVQIKLNYNNLITEAVISLEFVNPLDITYRVLSGQILQHILAVEQNRKKRQAEMQMMTGNVEESYLSAECDKLNDMEGFVVRIIDSLNSSFSAFERNLNLLLNTHSGADSNFNITITNYTNGIYQSINEHGEFRNYSISRFQELVTDYAYLQWQLDFDLLHNGSSASSDGSLGVSCMGLADCLQSILFNLIHAIQDTPVPGADGVLMKAKSLEDDISAISMHGSTFAQANHTLYSLLDIFSDLKSLEFWCSEPPMFVTQPPAYMNIQRGRELIIICDVYSTIQPVQYIWKRDSIVLSSSSRGLVIPNVDSTDAGHYQCTATNSAGTVDSVTTIVNILVEPVLSPGLEPVYEIMETYNNGVRLSCEASGWPVPNWKWLFQRSLDEAPTEINGEYGNTVVIDSPTQTNDEGWYTCVAYNSVGNATSGPSHLLVLPTTLSTMQYSIDLKLTTTTSSSVQSDDPTFIQSLTNELKNAISSKAIVSSVLLTEQSDNTYKLSFTLSTPSYTGLQPDSMEAAVAMVLPDIDNLELSKFILYTQDIVLNAQGAGNGVSLSSTGGSATLYPRYVSCPVGYEVSSNFMICVGCKPGHYGNGDKSTQVLDIGNGEYITQVHDQCTVCPIGYYQSNRSQSQCVKCVEEYTSTAEYGSTSSDDCIGLCPPHYISYTGLQPCEPCPYNHYQPEYGSTDCHECSSTDDVDVCHHTNTASNSTGPSITSTTVSLPVSHTIPYSSKMSSTPTNGPPSPSVGSAVGSDSGLVMTISGSAGAVVIVLIVILLCMVGIIVMLNRRSKRQAAIAHSMGINPGLRGSLELNRYEDSKSDEYYNTKKTEMEPDDKLGGFPTLYSCADNVDPIYEPIPSESAITCANVPLPPVPSFEIPDLPPRELPPRGVLRCSPHLTVNADYSEVGSLRSENEYMPMDSGAHGIMDNPDYEEVNKTETET